MICMIMFINGFCLYTIDLYEEVVQRVESLKALYKFPIIVIFSSSSSNKR